MKKTSSTNKSTKNLILLADLFSPGGIQAYSRHLFGAIEYEFGKRDFIVVTLNDLPKSESRRWANMRVKFCGQIRVAILRKMLFALKAIWLAFIHRPEFLICSHVHLAPLALLIKRFFGTRYAIITHGSDVWDLRGGMRFRSLKNAALIIAVSCHTKNIMVNNGIPQEKIKVLPGAVEASIFRPLPPNRDLAKQLLLEGKRVLLIISRLDSRERLKGHDIMLKVMQRLTDEFVLLIVGSGNDVERLRNMASRLGVAGNVRFCPAVPHTDTVDFYNLCDVFVMPSRQEGFGMVFLEAMACGKPVIAGCKDASKEPLMDGRLGFLVEPDDLEGIIKAIKLACTAKEEKTDPEYLRKQVEVNFGISAFNRRARETFAGYL